MKIPFAHNKLSHLRRMLLCSALAAVCLFAAVFGAYLIACDTAPPAAAQSVIQTPVSSVYTVPTPKPFALTGRLPASTSIALTDIEPAGQTPDKGTWYLALVNREHLLETDLSLTLVPIGNGFRIDARINWYLQQMLYDLRRAGGVPYMASGYRTYGDQKWNFQSSVNRYLKQGLSQQEAQRLTELYVAPAGASEHQLGLAVDILDNSALYMTQQQENTFVQQWLMANCYKYGFILRYPKAKEEITQIQYEPWHYRFVGCHAAKIIWKNQLCLEEYLTGDYQ